jgi:hypothetical protein
MRLLHSAAATADESLLQQHLSLLGSVTAAAARCHILPLQRLRLEAVNCLLYCDKHIWWSSHQERCISYIQSCSDKCTLFIICYLK